MRYPASEKLEIIRLVEQSPLGVRPTLEKLGIRRTTIRQATPGIEAVPLLCCRLAVLLFQPRPQLAACRLSTQLLYICTTSPPRVYQE